MEILEPFLSENQELVKPVELDVSVSLDGGTAPVSSTPGWVGSISVRHPLPIIHHGPIYHGPIIAHKG